MIRIVKVCPCGAPVACHPIDGFPVYRRNGAYVCRACFDAPRIRLPAARRGRRSSAWRALAHLVERFARWVHARELASLRRDNAPTGGWR